MEHLETPAFLVFLHQLAALLTLWGLASQTNSGLNLASISPSDMVACVPAAVLDSLHLILLFSALNHGSALLVVAMTQVLTAALSSTITVPAVQLTRALNTTQMVCPFAVRRRFAGFRCWLASHVCYIFRALCESVLRSSCPWL